MPPLGCENSPPEAACAGRNLPMARRRLRKSADSGKLVIADNETSPASAGYAGPPLRRALLFVGFGSLGLAEIGTARRQFRAHRERGASRDRRQV
jgi:hypothetical protein